MMLFKHFFNILHTYAELIRIHNIKLLVSSFTLLVISIGFLSWYTPILTDRYFHYWAHVIVTLLLVDDALFALISGPLADTWGRKRVAVAGTLFYPTGFSLIVFGMVLDTLGSSSLVANVLIALGLVLAMGVTTLASPAATALLMESVDPDRRGTAYSMFLLIESIVLSSGSILFAYLLDVLGPLRVFLLVLALSTISTVLRLFLRETLTGIKSGSGLTEFLRTARRNVVHSFKNPLTRLLLIFSLVVGVGHGIIFFVVPLYLSQRLGFSVTEIGLLYALIPLLRVFLSPVSGPLADRRPYLSLAAGTCLSGLLYSFLLLPLGRWVPALAMVVASSISIFEGVAYSKVLSDATKPSERATVFGLSHAIFSAGMPIGSLVGGSYYWAAELPVFVASIILASTAALIAKIREYATSALL